MPGTLTITTLSDGTNSTSATNAIQGSAKAWVSYKGTSTQSIRASYNVSSVTYNSTGDYTVNFTNAFADTNYSAVMSVGVTSGILLIKAKDATAPTTTSFRFVTFNSGGTVVDVEYIWLSFNR